MSIFQIRKVKMNEVCIYIMRVLNHGTQYTVILKTYEYYYTVIIFDMYHRKHVGLYINYENALQICIQQRVRTILHTHIHT